MTGSYLLYNELHNNGLMIDLGLTPSLCHLGEYPLQKYTLLHLCVIVPNLAEMFLLGHLQNSISSFPLSPLSPLSLLFSLSPSLARGRALQEFCFFCCHKCHRG